MPRTDTTKSGRDEYRMVEVGILSYAVQPVKQRKNFSIDNYDPLLKPPSWSLNALRGNAPELKLVNGTSKLINNGLRKIIIVLIAEMRCICI